MQSELTTTSNPAVPAPPPEEVRAWASAPVDLLEGEDAYLVFADLPGVAKDDVTVEYHQGQLRLHARRPAVEPEAGGTDFRRSFRVGTQVAEDEITAELADGILRVSLPKRASARPRSIEVRGV